VAVPVESAELGARLRAGDHVRVTRVSGERTSLRLLRVEPEALVGRSGGREVSLPRAECARVERVRIAWGRTTLLVAVVAVVLVGWAASNLTVIAG
jgi:hypothetical protein